MNKIVTGLVAVFVIAVAVSALLSGPGSRRDLIDIRVFDGVASEGVRRYDPVKTLLAEATRRPVLLHGETGWQGEVDLFVMSTYEYLTRPRDTDVQAIYEIARVAHGADRAVLIARAADNAIDLSRLRVGDVVFATPRSVNGCWQQLSLLANRGFEAPRDPGVLNFAGSDDDHSRIVLGVALGRYRVGACRGSDVARLVARGVIDAGEITVLESAPALPEILIAVSDQDVRYYSERLRGIAAYFEASTLPPSRADTVRLMQSRGMRSLSPVGDDVMGRLDDLFTEVELTSLGP